MNVGERVGYKARWRIRKFRNDMDHDLDLPYEVKEIEGNLLLNEGITRALNLIGGLGGTAYDNANARLGVGDDATAAAATQTGLLAATNVLFKAMDASFPSVSAQTITFRSTFGGTEANFAWEEFSCDNGATADENLNRLVSSQGTKTSGQTWELTLDVTLS